MRGGGCLVFCVRLVAEAAGQIDDFFRVGVLFSFHLCFFFPALTCDGDLECGRMEEGKDAGEVGG